VETRTVRFKEPTREDEDRELDELMDKLHGLSIRERTYAVLYARCVHRFPDVAQSLTKPEMCQSYAFQNTNPSPPTNILHQPWSDRSAPAHPAATSNPTYLQSRCMFCSQTNHRIKDCPIAQDYIRTGRAVVINNRIHLHNGQPIPLTSVGRNLQEKIDAWLAGSSAAVPPHPSDPAYLRDNPPHATHCFEIISNSSYGLPVQEAHIVEVLPSEEEGSDNEDADLFEVFATERKKRNTKVTQLPEFAQEAEEVITPAAASTSTNQSPPAIIPEATPPSNDKPSQNTSPASAPAPPFANDTLPSSTSRAVPQYRYLSHAEDQQLMTELFRWLLDGKLALITPAHILAASPGIRKELIDRLKTRRVDAGSYEAPSLPNAVPPFSVLELATPRMAEYSLPLREIDVLINGTVPEAGILDQGSQIIVIRWDLAQEAGVQFNPAFQLEMESANGLASKTLGCAENLSMQIGDVEFEVHAHIVERAPFRLLLGRPFHHHLLCRLEDHPDGRVDVSVRDPSDPSRSVTIPSRARKAQVGFVSTLAISSPLPSFTGLKPHHTLGYQFLDTSTPEQVLAYKKVARKVRPVSASLPEDYRIIRQIPVDPLLSLPTLPTHPPDFTPGVRLTQERLDDLDLNR
jgi:hypothetical protein